MFRARTTALVLALVLVTSGMRAAADQQGQVLFNGLPVPGATVVATQGEKKIAMVTDEDGRYRLSGLEEGAYSVTVEMLGFAPLTQEMTVTEGLAPAVLELTLLPFEEIKRIAATPPAPESRTPNPAAPSSSAASAEKPSAPPAPVAVDDELVRQAAEGFLVNGSVNNSAASPFAQGRAFGNNRRGQGSLYNGGFGATFGHSAFDARPFSFTAERTPKPDYTDLHIVGSLGGPLKIPGIRNRPVFFIGYQRTTDHNATTQSALLPTAHERRGDFSRTVDGFGRPVQIVDPATGLPFPDNVIPESRISPQAAALLRLYPEAAPDLDSRYNFQAPIVSASQQDNLQSRFSHTIDNRNSINGTLAYQRTNADNANLVGFVDTTDGSNLDLTVNWSRRFSQFLSTRVTYQFTRQSTSVTPHFANRVNVSGEAGILGNDQETENWGPPNLVFSSGIAALGTGLYARNRTSSHSYTSETSWRPRGRHNFTFGATFKPQTIDVLSQQNPRGTFGFSGAATGSDLADFLLGIPHTASIAFGNADKRLTAPSAAVYMNDDWRISPELTVNAGVRWEYEAPFAESQGRLVNLNVAPDFTAADPVVGARLRPDRTGIQPRLGAAIRPIAGSSVVIRAGYGIYRNTNVYQSIALMLSQQPPLSRAFSIENSAENRLTLATGFLATPAALANTFAVDPDFRVSYAHNWQVALQRDLPWSLTVTATYLGTKGSRLMQEFVPNTYPIGAMNPCPECPAGFVFLASNGTSSRNAMQLQLRRRLRGGLTAVTQYTLAKATDDAAAFTTAALNGNVIAQNWLDLGAERARSSFDQRHLLTAQVEYSGRGLLRDWTFTSQLNAGSGLPLTPVYLTSIAGTGVTGAIRADYTGAPLDAAPEGFYVNPAAFAPPAPGRWGTAARNSITGPAQFSLNAGAARTFVIGARWTLEWRLDATNVLNRVVYSSLNTLVGSPHFGLPNRANTMRKVLSSVRVRF